MTTDVKNSRGLFGEVEVQTRGILPNRSKLIRTKDILLAKQSVHEVQNRAALVLQLSGGQRAIDEVCEMIDSEGYFRCVLEEHQLYKLLKMLTGILASQKLEEMTRLVKPVRLAR